LTAKGTKDTNPPGALPPLCGLGDLGGESDFLWVLATEDTEITEHL